MINNNHAGAYENVRAQIGYCGIWCGSCAVGNGALRELAGRLESVLNAYGVGKWAPKGFDYEEFSKGLAAIKQLPLCPGCLQGGGRENCPMRACAKAQGLDDCTLCDDRGNCGHLEVLKHMRTGARAAGLLVKNPEDDREAFLADSEIKLKSLWPSSILFSDGV
jgi:Protein of unknown function (DUF3795)